MSGESPTVSGKKKKRRGISPLWSLAWLGTAWFLYARPTDATAAITVWPAWIAAGVGVLFALVSRRLRSPLVLGWIVFALVFVDEAKSIPRGWLPEPAHQLRVATLNCAGGTVAAAEEIERLKPDLVFLEESPGRAEVASLAKRFFGERSDFVAGPDASILARGTLIPLRTSSANSDFVAADWRAPDGHRLNVVALRLMPPVMRVDLVAPSAWSEFSSNRAARRREVARLADELERAGFVPSLIGGDFNTPPDRDVLSPLAGRLKDSFAESGIGLGATCVNPQPCLVRIDQLWHDAALVSKRARAVPTTYSDHKMLVADYDWAR